MDRKVHAGFGPAVEGEALVGNYRQAPHPTGISSVLSDKMMPIGYWQYSANGWGALD